MVLFCLVVVVGLLLFCFVVVVGLLLCGGGVVFFLGGEARGGGCFVFRMLNIWRRRAVYFFICEPIKSVIPISRYEQLV